MCDGQPQTADAGSAYEKYALQGHNKGKPYLAKEAFVQDPPFLRRHMCTQNNRTMCTYLGHNAAIVSLSNISGIIVHGHGILVNPIQLSCP